MFRRIRVTWLPGMLLAVAASGALAQAAPVVSPSATPLKQAFDAAWPRQPEATSRDVRQEAVIARRESAGSWTPEPPSLELSAKTDRFNADDGSGEYEIGLAVPLWLPGERSATGALADAQLRANASRTRAAQLRTAASVRTAYWDLQRARLDVAVARGRLANARDLAVDVARRVRAGDLARADGHQADGAVATAEASLVEAESALAAAAQQLRAMTGTLPQLSAESVVVAEPEPAETIDATTLHLRHPAAAELLDRTEAARRAVALAGVQGRANPELSLATTRERERSGDDWQQTVTVGVRIPFGSGVRSRARVASANAEAIEVGAELELERQRLTAGLDAARVRLESARNRIGAAERRARLATESRAFFQKAFRLGETDLPTRLRIEFESTEAERELARARIEHAAAVSALRQAIGLLPE